MVSSILDEIIEDAQRNSRPIAEQVAKDNFLYYIIGDWMNQHGN